MLTILTGDCRDLLKTLPDESVHCCVTSPPYWGLRDYKTEPQVWGGDVDCSHEWGDLIEVNATNHTDKRRWNHTRNGRDEEQPVEKRVAWLRTKVGQGSYCECGAWQGSLGLEPTPELFVEHIVQVFREVRRVLRSDGTLWLNLGDSYAASPGQRKVTDLAGPKQVSNNGSIGAPSRSVDGLKPKDLIGIPWRVAFALQADGWYLRSDIIWSKPNPMPESVTDRPTKAHEYLFLLSKSQRYYYNAEAIAEPASYLQANSPESIKSPYGQGFTRRAKGNAKTFRGGVYTNNGTFDNGGTLERDSHGNSPNLTGLRNKRTVWEIATCPYPEAHFATFPEALVEPCILAGSPTGGTVLDPFAGSGTVGRVALNKGRAAVLIELNPNYCKLIDKRCETTYGLQFDPTPSPRSTGESV